VHSFCESFGLAVRFDAQIRAVQNAVLVFDEEITRLVAIQKLEIDNPSSGIDDMVLK